MKIDQVLAESLAPMRYRLVSSSGRVERYEITTSFVYEVVLFTDQRGEVELEFSRFDVDDVDRNYGVYTLTGDASRHNEPVGAILGTVIQIAMMSRLVRQAGGFYFTSKEASRNSLYERILQRYGASYDKRVVRGMLVFTVTL